MQSGRYMPTFEVISGYIVTTIRNRMLGAGAFRSRLPFSSLMAAVVTAVALAAPLFGSDAAKPAPLAGATPPQIINFQAVEVSGGMWVFSGTVVDAQPGGLTVSFGGAPEALQGLTTTTDADGNFSIGVILNSNGSDTGTATAQTVDGQGLPSNVAQYYVDP
jgi:hypothetical protein